MASTLSSLLCLVFALPIPLVEASNAESRLPPEVETGVRRAVYFEALLLAHPLEGKYALLEVVVLPADIEAAYKGHPHATVSLLMSIVEGGRPRDSMHAASYALALIESPAVASVVCSVFKEDAYDAVDVDWKVTPRRHFIGKLKERIDRLKEKK